LFDTLTIADAASQGHAEGHRWCISRRHDCRTRCTRYVYSMYVIHLIFSIQNLASETAAYLTTKHPDYAVLAARIAISNLHKETTKNFSQLIRDLHNYGSYHLILVFVCWTNGFDCSEPEEWQAVGYDLERDA